MEDVIFFKTGTGVCRSDEFSCGETTGGTVCLGMEEVCNGYAICKDQSDELNCAIGELKNSWNIISLLEFVVIILFQGVPALLPLWFVMDAGFEFSKWESDRDPVCELHPPPSPAGNPGFSK